MGEMADYYLDNADYFDEDWYEDHNVHTDGPCSISCKYCGYGPLWWRMTNGSWRLIGKKGMIHSCIKYKR
jgi:hypothetical protein